MAFFNRIDNRINKILKKISNINNIGINNRKDTNVSNNNTSNFNRCSSSNNSNMNFGNRSSNRNGKMGLNFGGLRKNFGWNKTRSIYTLISKEEAANLIRTDSVILIDVRTKEEYESVHIQNAINIPVEELRESIAGINLTYNKKIMVYCSTGSRSKTAINILNSMGYTNIVIWEYSSLSTFPYQDMLVYTK